MCDAIKPIYAGLLLQKRLEQKQQQQKNETLFLFPSFFSQPLVHKYLIKSDSRVNCTFSMFQLKKRGRGKSETKHHFLFLSNPMDLSSLQIEK